MAERILGRDGLHSCPFCGSTSAPIVQRTSIGTQSHWHVWCDDDAFGCGAMGGTRLTEVDARLAWNVGQGVTND